MTVKRADFKERVTQSIVELEALFCNRRLNPVGPEPPPGTTVEEAWSLYYEAWTELQSLIADKQARRGFPRVADCVRLLLTNPAYSDFSNELVADLTRRMFAKYGGSCKCSPKSVGWYVSRLGIAWRIPPRKEVAVPASDDEGW